MTPIYTTCEPCRGVGVHMPIELGGLWVGCKLCEGVGRMFVPGAPAFGCKIILADRAPGEIVTLGNGDRARILWHQPRQAPKQRPETTFLGFIDDFLGVEDYQPRPYPSTIGVSAVEDPRAIVANLHDRGRRVDLDDPLQKTSKGSP